MRKKIWKILSLAAVLGLLVSFTGCGGDNDDTNYINTLGLSTAQLPAEFTHLQNEFNAVRDAGSGGFRGWAFEHGAFLMVWTGRNLADFNRVADHLNASGREQEDDGVWHAWGDDFDLNFFPSRISEEGYYLPAGTMMLYWFLRI